MAVSIQQVEEALQNLYTGYVAETLQEGSKAVPVFVDIPDPEEFPQRVYPSISIMLQDMQPAPDHDDSQSWYKESEDTSGSVNISNMRKIPAWYRLHFYVHTWATDALCDRNMVRWVESRKHPKDSIEIDGSYYWLFRTGFNTSDQTDGDTRIYHKLWRLECLIDFENEDMDESVMQAHYLDLTTSVVKTMPMNTTAGTGRVSGSWNPNPTSLGPTVERIQPKPVDADGNAVDTAAEAQRVESRRFAFDNNGFWFPS